MRPTLGIGPPDTAVRFGPFLLDVETGELYRGELRLKVSGHAIEVLRILIAHPGQLVTREELQRQIWPGDEYGDFEHGLNAAVKRLREVLLDSATEPRYIETLPRRGYRFIAPLGSGGNKEIDGNSNSIVTPETLPAALPAAPPPGVEFHPPAPRSFEWRKLIRSRVALFVGSALLTLVVGVAGKKLWSVFSLHFGSPATHASIAVLPFVDLSANHDQEYFSDGLAEEVLDHLSKIPNLRVAARCSAFRFKGKDQDLKTIGRQLHVGHILDGTVRREGDRIRISVQLIKVDDGYNLWAESYDRQFSDVFLVQESIADAVTSALRYKLEPSLSKGSFSGTLDPRAYDAFLQARYFFNVLDRASYERALHFANEAIRFDPNYAAAYAIRGKILLQFGGYAWINLDEAVLRAQHDAAKALELDPKSPEAYLLLSMIESQGKLNCRQAEVPLRAALQLAPNEPDILHQGAMLAMCVGRPVDGIDLMKKELLLDPLRSMEHMTMAQILLAVGRGPDAENAVRTALDLDPNGMMIHETWGEILLSQGRTEAAMEEMKLEPEGMYHDLGTALAYHARGDKENSEVALQRLISHNSTECAYQVAQIYGYRAQIEPAFEWLDRAYRQGDPGLMWLKTDFKMNSLRSDHRYAELLKKLNLSD